MEEFLIVTFESTNFAMQTEAVLKTFEIRNQIIPTPREITLSCGLSIRTPIENFDKIVGLIDQEKIRNKSLFKMKGSGVNKTIEEIRR
jgi:hypothetical protein